MTTDELRESYLDFFGSKGCVRRPSDLLVPPNDPSVLFTPAGMNQFKEQFLGIGPLDFTRATTCQKCIRTGDIENVGRTRFHMTFFEMLGNFSFGDYFKREAIHWAWEYCTKVLKFPPDKLNVTVYLDDEEAFGIWHDEVKLPSSRIRRCDEDQNFWPASAPTEGPNGVCGPCSEIYFDLGGGNEVEIWNLVFTQFNRVGFKHLEPLPKKNIDTGMGLERLALVLQNVPTVFDIDIMKPIVMAASEAVGMTYEATHPESYRLRRIAEHSRTVTFCMHEGVAPSNEKQGYVVRRLLRRAVLDAYQLGRREPFLYTIVPAVVAAMQKAYPEVRQNAESVAQSIKGEEERFLRTVETGITYLENLLRRAESQKRAIQGEEAFELHATYGFPVELTEEFASQRQVPVDRAGFESAMEEHRKRSGTDAFSAEVFALGPIHEVKKSVAPTIFVGYEQPTADGVIQAIIAGSSLGKGPIDAGHPDPIIIILDRSPFYGESGGQVGDIGTIHTDELHFEVTDTHKTDGYLQHVGFVRRGSLRIGQKVSATINAQRRQAIERAHSSTHILHWALHQVLGKHATQAGSKVEDDLLRFDFSHPKAMSAEEIEQVERLANEKVMAALPIAAKTMPIEQARQLGAMALFGEKYGDTVRVVTMGEFSREFCGGCHLSNTGQAGPLRILREESVSAGTRRLVATTGLGALRFSREQSSLLAETSSLLKTKPEEIPARVGALQSQIKDLQKSLDLEKSKQNEGQAQDLLLQSAEIAGVKVVVALMEGADAKQIQAQVDQLMAKGNQIAVLLAAQSDSKVDLVAAVSKDVPAKGLDASAWVRAVAEIVGGKGGGKPTLARAGGTDPAKLPAAIALAKEWASNKLGG
jgi:alanyl-tRNA synthetase